MRKNKKKIMAVCLSASLVCGMIGATAYASSSDSDNKEPDTKDTAWEAAGENETAAEKDETVYVLAGADGSVNKIIVSDWIKNTLGSASLYDASELTDVVNVKGEESYTMNGENMRVWDAEGNDIYYQGNIEKELPVKLSVTYTLDKKAVSPSELAGKSGHLTMRFDYENNQYEMVEIDGRQEKIYVPFAMVTGMLLDNAVFRNVEVSNGKLINDGNRTVVVGIALPGLQENLNIEKEDLDIPDYVEISADVTDFELMTTMTVATNEIFNQFDDASLDDFDSLSDSFGELTDAMDQLMDGSAQLYEGLNTLYEKSGDLIDGINQLADGAKALKDGTGELAAGAAMLADGAGDMASGIDQLLAGATELSSGTADLSAGTAQLKSGSTELSAGLDTLSSNSAALNGGAKQVFDTLLAAADSQIAAAGLTVDKLTINNYADVLDGVIASLDEETIYDMAYQAALKQVTEAVYAQESAVRAAVTEAVKAQITQKVREQVVPAVRAAVKEQVLAKFGMTTETYDAAVAAGQIPEAQQKLIEAAIEAQMNTDDVQAVITEQVNENVEAQMASEEVAAMIDAQTESQMQALIDQNMASEKVQGQIAAAVEKAEDGVSGLVSLKAQLDSYNEFYQGVLTYTKGVDSAAVGAAALKNGAGALEEGAAALDAGAEAIKTGIGVLKNGADSLKEGTANLKGGAGSLDSGAGDLYNGILSLKDGSDALAGGVKQLRDGSMELSDGLKQFKEEGIQKLADVVDGDLNGLITRLRATSDVSKNYKSFSGISDEMEGQVKFIYRTDSIKK